MATLGSSSPPASPSFRVRRKSLARTVERFCCGIVTYFPLFFVYGLTTWAVWVEVGIGLRAKREEKEWSGLFMACLAVTLYLLADISYTVAVITDPGSPMSSSAVGYSRLPTHEAPNATSLTVKSTGTTRYCKKCRCKKPDRAHHCSTCKRCVLKMDHHCPWLATCLGLRNYKAFVLFLIYTSLLCWVCFIGTAGWVYRNILTDGKYMDTFMPVNYVLLAVVSGIIGLVLTGFTIWHISLVLKNQTTIECMERVRYLSPLRKSLQNQQHQQYQNQQNFLNGNPNSPPNYAQQLMDIHANILPGVTREEEGEERPSPGTEPYVQPHHTSYNDLERIRERDRYDAYLDEQLAEKLPNAFDLGWKNNFLHLFGPKPILWGLPVCNSTGDGWRWEPSPKWLEARERLSREREGRWRQQEEREREAGWGSSPVDAEQQRERDGSWGGETLRGRDPSDEGDDGERYMSTSLGVASVPVSGRRSPSKADQILGRSAGSYADSMRAPSGGSDGGMSMRTLHQRGDYIDEEEGVEFEDAYEGSSGEEDNDEHKPLRKKGDEAGWGRKKVVGGDEESGLVAPGIRRNDGAEDEWREW